MSHLQRLLILGLTMLVMSGCAVSLPLANRAAPAASPLLTQSAESGSGALGQDSAAMVQQLSRLLTEISPSAPAVEQLSSLSTGTARATECPFLSYEEAITIVMEAIPPAMEGDADLCGYGGLLASLLGEANLLSLGESYGVAAGVLTGETELDFFRRMATALNEDTGEANIESYNALMDMFDEGDLTYAVQGLNEIVLGVDDWITFDYAEEGDFPHMVFIKPEAEGGPFILFVGRDIEDRTFLTVAHVGPDSPPTVVMPALYGVVDRLLSISTGSAVVDPVTTELDTACSYLTQTRAEEILAKEVESSPGTADQCHYYFIEDYLADDAVSSVSLVFARGDEALDYISEMTADIADQRPRPSRVLRNQLDDLLAEGDLRAALNLIPNYAARQQTIQLRARPDVGADVIGVVWEMDARLVRGLVAVHPNGDLILLLVNLYQAEHHDEGDAALVSLMQEILASGELSSVDPQSGISQGRAGVESAPGVTVSPEERLTTCYGLQPADAEAILGEAVTPETTINEQYGYCVYASVAANQTPGQDDLLPTVGPRGSHQYLAVTVWPVGSATDPLMYLSFAILDREHAKLNAFLQEFSGRAALEELASVDSQLPNLSRAFLPDLGDGALWYWQESTNGDHLAGLYAIVGAQRIAVQALVNSTRSQADVRAALVDLVARLMQEGR